MMMVQPPGHMHPRALEYSWWLYSLCLVMEEEKKKNKKGYSLSDDSWAPEGKPSHSDWSGGWGGNAGIAMVIQWGDKLGHQIELLFSEKSWKPRDCWHAGMPLLWVVGLRFALVQVMSSCFFPCLKQEAKLTVFQKARKVWVQKSCTSQHFMAVSSIIAAFRTDKHFYVVIILHSIKDKIQLWSASTCHLLFSFWTSKANSFPAKLPLKCKLLGMWPLISLLP